MKKNIYMLIILTLILGTSCNNKEETDVMKILPFNEEKIEKDLVQIYLPNKNLSCVITELVKINGITNETYLDRVLERITVRSMESDSFINMNILNVIKVDLVEETVFLTIEWKDNLSLSEEHECLILYSIVNTVEEMDGVEYVKIINGNSKYFNNWYSIEEALNHSNTILYKDYISPISTIKRSLFMYYRGADIHDSFSEDSIEFLNNNFDDYIDYRIINYSFNQYNTLLTVKTEMTFLTDDYQRIDNNLNFLLEYNNGKFKIKEIFE